MEKSVKLLHLLNGEDIIAEINDDGSGDVITITNPARIIVMMPPQRPGGSASVGMAPWLQFSDTKTISIQREHVMYQANPVKDLLDNYQQMFSNLVLPKTSLVMP